MASVVLDPRTGRYRVWVSIKGKSKPLPGRGYETKGEADEAGLQAELDKRRAQFKSADPATFGELAEAFLADLKIDMGRDDKAGATYLSYRGLLQGRGHVLEELGGDKLATLSRARLQGFIDKKRERGASHAQLEGFRTVINRTLKYGLGHERVRGSGIAWLDVSPLTGNPLSIGKRKPRRISVDEMPNDAELEAILHVLRFKRPFERELPHANRVLEFRSLIFTGARRADVLGLQGECVDTEVDANGVGRLTLQYSLVADGLGGYKLKDSLKTDAGIRTMPLLPFMVRAFERHFELTGRRKGFVFLTENGRPISPTNVSGFEFKFIMTHAHFHLLENGLESRLLRPDGKPRFSLHKLRHAFASWLVKKGVPLGLVQAAMGWANIHMVDTYAHLAPVDPQVVEAMQKLAAKFGFGEDPDLPQLPAPDAAIEILPPSGNDGQGGDPVATAVVRMRQEDIHPREISRLTGLKPSRVYAILERAGTPASSFSRPPATAKHHLPRGEWGEERALPGQYAWLADGPRICAREGCNVEFTPKKSFQKYCHPSCRVAVHRQRAKDERAAAAQMSWSQPRLCANPDCGEVFKPDHPGQEYHSRACARAVEQSIRRAKRAAAPKPIGRPRLATPGDDSPLDRPLTGSEKTRRYMARKRAKAAAEME